MTAVERALLEVAYTEQLLSREERKRAFREALIIARDDWQPASKQTRLKGLQGAN